MFIVNFNYNYNFNYYDRWLHQTMETAVLVTIVTDLHYFTIHQLNDVATNLHSQVFGARRPGR